MGFSGGSGKEHEVKPSYLHIYIVRKRDAGRASSPCKHNLIRNRREYYKNDL